MQLCVKFTFRAMKNYLLLTIILLISSCKEDSNPPCGCGGPTLNTVPSDIFKEVPFEVQKSGLMFFKDEDIIEQYVPDDQWEHKFWILQDGCTACVRAFIVCNEDILGNQFNFLKEENNNDSIPIRFEGNLMTVCDENQFITPADILYLEIVLTSIEKAN